MAGCSVPPSLSLIHNPRSLLQCTPALHSSVLNCETAATSLKTRYSANNQGNSQTSNEGRARENDPEPVGVICVVVCVALCVALFVAFTVELPVLLFIVPMLVLVAVAADVVVAEVFAMTDVGHVGPAE
jgi:hypothetical protein